MCSFIGYSGHIKDLEQVNALTVRRGPDLTRRESIGGWDFVHNLLSITGSFTGQPFTNSDKSLVGLFNGEIYNWKHLNKEVSSDGEILLPLYEQYGPSFTKMLDGEFAIAIFDFVRQTLVLSTDAFSTKPLWFADENGAYGVASYKSALIKLGFLNPIKIEANKTIVIDLKNRIRTSEFTVFEFDPRNQYKDSLDDFFNAFSSSISKRTKDARENIFLGVSGGYDSGAILLELLNQKVDFEAYSILGQENKEVLLKRHALLKEDQSFVFDFGLKDYHEQKRNLKKICEPFEASLYDQRFPSRNIIEDAGAVGLGLICSEAKKRNNKIYLSGQGADEILSDYRMHGKGLTGHSTIDGHFPEDLGAIFPWHNFYKGAQEFYIAKEEHVAGAYGIEARYPFLDPHLVQEFLFLSPRIKNLSYKYPLQAFFEKYDFPYAQGEKVGFIPRKKNLNDYVSRIFNGQL